MKKFVIGLVTGFLLTFLSLFILFFAALKFGLRTPAPTVADNSTLVVRLSGGIPEKSPVQVPLPFVGSTDVATVHDLWMTFRKAAADQRIKSVVLMVEGLGAGWGKLDELRYDIEQFRKSGKPVYAYLKRPRTRDYYVATAAERIYMAPEDLLDLKGMRAELTYFKKTLDKIGVQVDVVHIGKYKNAGDMFTETTSTPETREVMNSVLDTVYGDLVRVLGAGRKKSPEEMRAILDKGPFTADQAKALGLVDELWFEDQLYDAVKTRLKQSEVKKLAHTEYMKVPASTVGIKTGKSIAFIVGEGTIMSGAGTDAMGTDEGFTSGAFIKMLRQVRDDKGIAGAIIRIDSPGGDAMASDEILREVKLLSQKKPVVFSMSDAAASGGYYVAMTGDPIFAYPNTYTGSIGIVFGKMNLRGLYEKLGITKDVMTRGENAAIDSTYVPMTPQAEAKLREVLQDFYTGFVSKAAQSRKMQYAELEPLAQGRVWLGSQAKAHRLIDELGGIDRAVEAVKRKANIPAADSVRLVPYPPKRTIFDQWLKSTEPTVEAKLEEYLGPIDLKLWSRGGIMRLMPYRIDVQ